MLRLLLLLILPSLALANDEERAGPDWWSLQPVKNPSLPRVQNRDWASNAIDLFILEKLEAKQLLPAPRASRELLIRRVTFDLIGLPPTPEQVDAFVQDRSPNAYAKLIDRLLASPQYGERWARHWLDAVRFSESHGFEYDRLRDNAWPYRDYVIRSLNQDKPYAQFVREQLAGDVQPQPTRESIVATGFLVAGPYDQAGNFSASQLIRARAREDELEDMLSAVGQTFLGMTVNCARCHNHKFDPIPAKDYYRMKAVFEGVFAGERSILSPDETRLQQQRFATWETRRRGIEERIHQLELTVRARIVKTQPREELRDLVRLPLPIARWSFEGDSRDSLGNLDAELKNGASIRNGRLVVDGKGAYAVTKPLVNDLAEKTLEAWVALTTLDQRGGGVMTVQQKNGGIFDSIVFGERQPRRWMAGSNGFVRYRDSNTVEEKSPREQLIHVAIRFSSDRRIRIFRNGEPEGDGYQLPESETAFQRFAAKESVVLFGLRHTGAGNGYLAGEIEEARLYDQALSPESIAASYRAGWERIRPEVLQANMTEAEKRDWQTLQTELKTVLQSRPESVIEQRSYAVVPKQPPVTYELHRGDVEKKRDPMPPAGLSVIATPSGDFKLTLEATDSERRLRFADWVVDPAHPLTWRVMANRVWQHHFGEGIVRSPNDFGFNGERPSHPELLDYLAGELTRSGGSLKQLHRLILLSSTYQQASIPAPQATKIDSENRLLWRYPLRRIEAEVIRDSFLQIGQQLNMHSGGPGFRPFRIETFNSAFYVILNDDKPEWNRRSIYRINVNSAKDPLLDSFDCPDPSVKTPRRSNTTTPLQALTMMNGEFVQRISRRFADRLKAEATTLPEQIQFAYRLCYSRTPTEAETRRAQSFIEEHGLSEFCWALLNSNEMVFLR